MSDVKILDVNSVDESQLPLVIKSQFDDLTEIENNIQKAVNMAIQAKQKATDAQVPSGLFKKKKAIKLLQDAVNDSTEAQITAVDAQKILFKYQTKLTEITKFLFGLGVSNLAMNRSVVRELELKLKGASEEEISDLAKQELRNVIMQLKAQEDILKKLTDLTGKAKEHKGQIDKLSSQINDLKKHNQSLNTKIIENADKISNQEKELYVQKQKDEKHDAKLKVLNDKDEEHDAKLKVLNDKDKQHEELIAENADKISNQENELYVQKQKDEEHDAKLKVLNDKDEEHDAKLEALNNKDGQHEKLIAENADKISNQERELLKLQSDTEDIKIVLGKKGWKIAVFVIAAISLIIDVLQILRMI